MYSSGGQVRQIVARQSRTNLNKRLALRAPDSANETAMAIAETGGMPQVPIVNIANDLAYAKYPGQIYVNLDMNPGITNDYEVGQMPVLQFNERRAGTLIEQPAAYEMSIIRFNVNTSDVPIMIVPIRVGQTHVNKTIYDVTFYQNAAPHHTVTSAVTWVPQYNDQPTPAAPLINQDVNENSRYYYLTDYNYFVDLVNNALQDAMGQFNTAAGTTYQAPFIRYNEQSHLMTMYAPADGFGIRKDNTAPPVGMYFNTPLRLLFPGFRENIYPNGKAGSTDLTWQYPFNTDISGDNIYWDANHAQFVSPYGYNAPNIHPHLLVPWQTYQSGGPPPTDVTTVPIQYWFLNGNNPAANFWIENSQQFPALQNWSTFSGLVFGTTFPIVPESLSNPVAYGVANLGSVSANAASFPIITDFSTTGDLGFEPFNGTVTYNPTSEYRMTSLTGTSAISDINITVYWKDPYNRLYPLRAWPGAQNNIKLMFRKKNTTM